MSRFFSGKNIIITVGIIILVMVVVNYTGRGSERMQPMEGFLRNTTSPVYNFFTGAGEKFASWFSYPASLVNASSKNEQLEQRVEELQAELQNMEEIKQQNERLKRLLDWKEQDGRDYVTEVSSVIKRDPGNWLGTIVINKGREDGIARDMTVAAPEGLVGRIINVSRKTSEVLLITDPRSGVGALIQKTRVPGIVEGVADGSANLQMNHIPADMDVKKGQTVVTSGQGSIYPKGIAVGTVTSVKKGTSGLFKVATVKPFVDFNRLEEVLVIKQ